MDTFLIYHDFRWILRQDNLYIRSVTNSISDRGLDFERATSLCITIKRRLLTSGEDPDQMIVDLTDPELF